MMIQAVDGNCPLVSDRAGLDLGFHPQIVPVQYQARVRADARNTVRAMSHGGAGNLALIFKLDNLNFGLS